MHAPPQPQPHTFAYAQPAAQPNAFPAWASTTNPGVNDNTIANIVNDVIAPTQPGDAYVEEVPGADGKPVRHCFLCDVVFNSAIMEASHCQGKKHKKKMGETRGQSIDAIRANSKFHRRDQKKEAIPKMHGRCDLCGVDFPTAAQETSHMQGKKHKENVRLRAEGKTHEIKKHRPKSNYFNSYNKLAPSCRQAVEHGMRINAKLKNSSRGRSMSPGLGSPGTPTGSPGMNARCPVVVPLADPYVEEWRGIRRCTLCDVTFNSAIMEASHIQGNRHKLAASAWAGDPRLNPERKPMPTEFKMAGRCATCDVDFPTEAQRASHMTSKSHKENVRLEGAGQPLKKRKKTKGYYSSFARLPPSCQQNVEHGLRIIAKTDHIGSADGAYSSWPPPPQPFIQRFTAETHTSTPTKPRTVQTAPEDTKQPSDEDEDLILASAWSVWTKTDGDFKSIATFKTDGEFWNLFAGIKAASMAVDDGSELNLGVFKKGIANPWKNFEDGGAWVLQFAPRTKKINPDPRDEAWVNGILALIANGFEHPEDVCGIVLHIEEGGSGKGKLELWIKDANDQGKRKGIGEQFKEHCEVDDMDGDVGFQTFKSRHQRENGTKQ